MKNKKSAGRKLLLATLGCITVLICSVELAQSDVMKGHTMSTMKNGVSLPRVREIETLTSYEEAWVNKALPSDEIEEAIYSLIELYQYLSVMEATGGNVREEKALVYQAIKSLSDKLLGSGFFDMQALDQETRKMHRQLAQAYVMADVLEDLLPDYGARYAKLMQAARRGDLTSYRPPTSSEISLVAREIKQAGGNMGALYERQIRAWLNRN